MAHQTFILCGCCALKLAGDDESACRDHHGHDHVWPEVPTGTVITQGPHEWNGTGELPSDCHEGGTIGPKDPYWVAELVG